MKSIITLFFILFTLPLLAASARLTWQASVSGNVIGYKIYSSSVSGNYVGVIPTDVGNALTFMATGLTPGITTYFVATCYTSDQESGFSNEAHYTPLFPPSGLTPTNLPPTLSLNFTPSKMIAKSSSILPPVVVVNKPISLTANIQSER